MINKNKLKRRLTQSIHSFAKLGETTYHNGHQLTYIDNGADILAVCHLDVVLKATPQFYGDFVKSPQLDDRLGAHIILDVLPAMGLKYDLILCDAEEIGQSTAANFIPPKAYKWAFEFDRQGTDSVLYDYESNKSWKKAVSKFSQVGQGSFSDISELTDWGFCAVNWGCGYHMQHSLRCYANLRDTNMMVNQFVKFYEKYKNRHFKFQYPKYKAPKWGNWPGYYDDYETDPFWASDRWTYKN
jgi:hypothetical protein